MDRLNAEQLVEIAALEIRDHSKQDDIKEQEWHSDQFSVYLVWQGKEPLLPGRTYEFISPNATTICSVSSLKYRLEPNNKRQIAAATLKQLDIGYCNIELDQSIDYAPASYDDKLGKFILNDSRTGEQVAIGLIQFGLRRATNIRWQEVEIGQVARAIAKQQKPHVLWFTGLSGSGKSTIASLLEKKLHARGHHTYLLDGDNVRHGLCRDLGFTDADRVENIRRISETARLFVDAGLIVIISFISPFTTERRMARSLFKDGEFSEIYVNTPLEICEKRDPKGLYEKARRGEIKNFTGLDSPYEVPEQAEIILNGGKEPPEALSKQVLDYLILKQLI